MSKLYWEAHTNYVILSIAGPYLQATQPPPTYSGALTTLVWRITPGLPEAFLAGTTLSEQYGQCQSLAGPHFKPKQAATHAYITQTQ